MSYFKEMLKAQWFSNENKLSAFVNEKGITRENIQSIAGDNTNGYVLFYWEVILK